MLNSLKAEQSLEIRHFWNTYYFESTVLGMVFALKKPTFQ